MSFGSDSFFFHFIPYQDGRPTPTESISFVCLYLFDPTTAKRTIDYINISHETNRQKVSVKDAIIHHGNQTRAE